MVSSFLSSVLDSSIGTIISGFVARGDGAIFMDVSLVLRWMWRMLNVDGSVFMVVLGGFIRVGGGIAGE